MAHGWPELLQTYNSLRMESAASSLNVHVCEDAERKEMKEPNFDSDGYPTEETLDAIKSWPYKQGYLELMAFCKACWAYPDYFYQDDAKDETFGTPVAKYYISTGGWSGNESVIDALQENKIFWALCWVQSRRGGHYIFEVRK